MEGREGVAAGFVVVIGPFTFASAPLRRGDAASGALAVAGGCARLRSAGAATPPRVTLDGAEEGRAELVLKEPDEGGAEEGRGVALILVTEGDGAGFLDEEEGLREEEAEGEDLREEEEEGEGLRGVVVGGFFVVILEGAMAGCFAWGAFINN